MPIAIHFPTFSCVTIFTFFAKQAEMPIAYRVTTGAIKGPCWAKFGIVLIEKMTGISEHLWISQCSMIHLNDATITFMFNMT